MQGTQADELLRRQQELLEELGGVLRGELDLLLAADVAALPPLAERKSALCGEIDALERQLDAVGTVRDPARGEAIRALARDLAQANQRNGVVVAALMRNTQGALDILRGIASGPAVYGPQGQTLPGQGSGKALGQA